MLENFSVAQTSYVDLQYRPLFKMPADRGIYV